MAMYKEAEHTKVIIQNIRKVGNSIDDGDKR